MKKIYEKPVVDITVFDNGDNTNTVITRSGAFNTTRAEGVGRITYSDMFDY